MQHQYHPVEVARLASGQILTLPIHKLQGARGGQTIGISAGIHGDEGLGVEVLRRLFNDPEIQNLTGCLLLLPLANPLAFAAYNRNTPIDMMNLNRVFPGEADGWLTEQLATAITAHFLTQIDIYIDLHAGGLFPVVDYVYQLNAPELSRAFCRRFLYEPSHAYEGTSTGVTVANDVPSVVVELGGGLVPQEPYIEETLTGIKNALRSTGALPGEVTHRSGQMLLHRIDIVRPHQGGLYVPVVDRVGVEVREGEILGRVVSPFDFDVLEEMTSPLSRGVMILTHPTTHRIEPGDYGYMIGDLDSAELLP